MGNFSIIVHTYEDVFVCDFCSIALTVFLLVFVLAGFSFML